MAPTRLLSIAFGLIAALGLLLWFFARPQPVSEPAGPDQGPPGERAALVLPREETAEDEPAESAEPGEPPVEEPPPEQPPPREPRREARAREPRWPQGVRGRLLGPGDRPIAGARVLAGASDPRWPWPLDARAHPASARRPPAETSSKADGRFELLQLEPGALRVAVRREGFADIDLDELWLCADEVLDLGERRLEPALALDGRVLGLGGEELGTPVDVVRLPDWLPRPAEELNARCGSPLARTDAEGRFRVERLGAGAVTLLFSHPARPEVTWTGVVRAEEPRGEVVVHFPETGSIAGRVRDAGEAEAPLWVRAVPARALLHALDSRVLLEDELEHCAGYRESPVDADGRFELTGLPPARRCYLRLLRADQLLEAPDAFAPWSVASPGPARVDLARMPGGSLELAVSDRASGAPLEDFELRLDGADPARPPRAASAARQADERVVWSGIRPLWNALEQPQFLLGSLLSPARERPPIALEVSAPGYELRRLEPIDLASGELLRLGWIGLERMPQLRVRVLDEADDSPIAGARVELSAAGPLVVGRGQSLAHSDASGDARLDPVGSAASELIASAPGYAPRLERDLAPWGASGAAERGLELRLGPPALVELRVAPEASRSVEVLHAWRDARTLAPSSRWTAPGGTASFRDLAAGTHGFAARAVPRLGAAEALAEPPQWSEAVVRHGQSLLLELAVARLLDVDGVLAWGGVPVAGADLQLLWGSGRSAELDASWTNDELPIRARTDRDGRFRFERLLPGLYSLVVRLRGEAITTRYDVAVGASARGLAIDLAAASLSGAAVGNDGAPVAGTEIQLLPLLPSLEQAGFGPGSLISDLFRYGKPLQGTVSAANGTFAFSAVPLGIDLVLAAMPGPGVVMAGALPLAHPGGGQAHVGDLVMLPTGRITVDVRSRSRLPAGHTLVALASSLELPSPVGLAVAGPLSHSGRIRFEGLIPGRWRFSLCLALESEYVLEVGPWTEVEIPPARAPSVDLIWPAE